MIDKLGLNNQFLANKKKVQQAKVNVINKLVNKIRKIKRANEKKPENVKLKTKIERTKNILACVKKLKNVDVLKKSLINEKNPNSIITNGNSRHEAVAESLLFKHKSVSETTKQLKELFLLNDAANPGWKDELLELSKRKKKLLRIESRKNPKQGRQERLQKFRKHDVWHENSPLLDDTQNVEEDDDSKPRDWDVSIENIREPVEKSTILKVDDSIKEFKTENVNKFVTSKVTNLSSQTEPTHAVDPFFVTKTGENYLSTVVINRVQAEPLDDGLVRKERRAEIFGYTNKKSKIKTNYRNHTTKKFELRNNKHENERTANIANEGLQPSWAAKQKQKGIPEFHGKKIKFEDNGEGNINEIVKSKNLMNVNSNKEKLHPSWEAKQKMKPIITDFKGTKIVFDED